MIENRQKRGCAKHEDRNDAEQPVDDDHDDDEERRPQRVEYRSKRVAREKFSHSREVSKNVGSSRRSLARTLSDIEEDPAEPFVDGVPYPRQRLLSYPLQQC